MLYDLYSLVICWTERRTSAWCCRLYMDPDVISWLVWKCKRRSCPKKSGFFNLVEKGIRLNGENIHLTERRTELRECIVGDSSFPLLPWLLTPYQRKLLPLPQTQFNRRHSETTKPGQMALWKLKDKWRIINGVMWRPDRNRLPKMIFVCCLLHNILLDMDDQTLDDSLMYHQHDVVFYDQSSLWVVSCC